MRYVLIDQITVLVLVLGGICLFLLGVKEITRNDWPLDILRENCVCSLMLKEKGIKESCRAYRFFFYCYTYVGI